MANFPTLSVQPTVEGWMEEKAFDPTIRARSEAGYTKTRPRCTRIPKKWSVAYNVMTVADKGLLTAFEDSVKVGADAFAWTCPADSAAYTVRFAEPVKYSMAGNKLYWRAEMVLEQV